VKKKLFNSFFNLILKKKSAHLKYILINKSLLHPYHYNCVVNESVLNSATSIVKFLDQKKYSYKIFHHHSVILSLKAVNKAQFYNKDFFTLDSNLLSLLNLRFKDISYEENLNYLSLFSFDDNYFERNGFYYILSTLIKNSYTLNFLSIINLNYLYFELKLFLFSTLQKKLFTKITYSNKKNDKNNIFFKKHIFIINQLKYKKNKLLHFIKTLNNIIPGKINLKDFSLFFIFLIFIFFIRFFNKFLVLNLKSCKFIFNTVINSKTIKQMFYLIIIYNYILKKCTK
jgi:hypothetical protein